MMPVHRLRMRLRVLHRLVCTRNPTRWCDSLTVADRTCDARIEHTLAQSRNMLIYIYYSSIAQVDTGKYR